jgi:hypothetical protein
VIARWALVVADYRREYQVAAGDLARMALPEFLWLLQGLSEHSVFLRAWHHKPKVLHPDERAALIAAARA